MTGAPPPLYGAVMTLCALLLESLAEEAEPHAPLRRRLAEGGLRLVDEAALALAGFERGERLRAADAELLTLRAHLALAFELGVLGERRYLILAEHADDVGRQIGGWRKKVDRHTACRSTPAGLS